MTTPNSQTEIKVALDRSAKAMELRDSVGKGTAITQVLLNSGLKCQVEENEWRLATDMSTKMGGEGSAPNPGVIGRAAIGTCFATSFAMWAARMEVPFDEITVDVEADYDARGEFGVDEDVPPSYLAMRIKAKVVSDAPEQKIREILAKTERHTSWLDLVRRPIDATTHYEITGGR